MDAEQKAEETLQVLDQAPQDVKDRTRTAIQVYLHLRALEQERSLRQLEEGEADGRLLGGAGDHICRAHFIDSLDISYIFDYNIFDHVCKSY